MSGRMVKLSERAQRKLFAGYLPIDLAKNPAMAERRKARRARKNSGYCLPGQRRACRAKNVLGRVIWINKPRRFGAMRWIERRACVASFMVWRRACDKAEAALVAANQERFGWSPRREWHQFGVDALAISGGGWSPLGLRDGYALSRRAGGVEAGGPLDAPEFMAAGGVVSLRGEPAAALAWRDGAGWADMAGEVGE